MIWIFLRCCFFKFLLLSIAFSIPHSIKGPLDQNIRRLKRSSYTPNQESSFDLIVNSPLQNLDLSPSPALRALTQDSSDRALGSDSIIAQTEQGIVPEGRNDDFIDQHESASTTDAAPLMLSQSVPYVCSGSTSPAICYFDGLRLLCDWFNSGSLYNLIGDPGCCSNVDKHIGTGCERNPPKPKSYLVLPDRDLSPLRPGKSPLELPRLLRVKPPPF